MDSLQEYHIGRETAETDVDTQHFDIDMSISSFDYDRPDTPFQRGYLRGLLKCGYATVTSKWDGELV